ncbi:hypothetical protein EZM97_19145 [Dyella soli]|uniref:Tetratricopeptide repeat protein n=1 Tax=Dyella soli TaxID=522319 RepID=A0A4R0YYB3_9GAMM|nr:hypothetical protein EZM97_19145 [Dyella soli]
MYSAGLSGTYVFDDYPNIVDNKGVQPSDSSFPSLIRAALSSPSSEFKRPLASLSFALNYLMTGLDPYWMKVTNLVIHLLNGVLAFLLTRTLCTATRSPWRTRTMPSASAFRAEDGLLAALIAAAWLLLPINLTAVLYVVQRMESMANLFVLAGLLGYVKGRMSMQREHRRTALPEDGQPSPAWTERGLLLCVTSITLPTLLGLLAKETAVMLPLYALLVEWVLFQFRSSGSNGRDRRVVGLFLVLLLLPMLVGLAWLLPGLLQSEAWTTRDFTLRTRLLSECRIVIGYLKWTLWPAPSELSFYHDNFRISSGLLSPWTTLASFVALIALLVMSIWLRFRQPLAALGILLFLACHVLTGTVLPLELVYEHRNYFASFGVLLAVVPLLIGPPGIGVSPVRLRLARRALLACLFLWWTGMTAITAQAWGNPLRLAIELAARGPESPRAQYELGRTYIIYSKYDPKSRFTVLANEALQKAASIPNSSILPLQALIFMNSRMHLPLDDQWWDAMITKLKDRKPGVQDESSLGALTQCAHDGQCDLPHDRMVAAYLAALSHPHPTARLLAMYSDYAWNVLGDRALGQHMIAMAVETAPKESAYRLTQIRMLLAQERTDEARAALNGLRQLNIGGQLDVTVSELSRAIAQQDR